MTHSGSRITTIEASTLDVPLHKPFGIAGGVQSNATNVLVTITLEDGTKGYGEGAPLPAYNGQTQAGTLEASAIGASAIEGADARNWRTAAATLREAIGSAGCARCALEMAQLDALLRQRGLQMSAFFGGVTQPLETDVTITTGSVQDARDATEHWGKVGFRNFKVKVGTDLDHDIERVVSVAKVQRGATINLDANASMTSDEAIRMVQRLQRFGVDVSVFEQPTRVGDWDELARVARHVVVAADENVVTASDALMALQLGAPHVINIKTMKAGIVEALDVAAVARAGKMRLMIGGNVESLLSMTVSAHIAGGLGGFSFVDLDTPLFFAENPFQGGYPLAGPLIELPPSIGHGVTPLHRMPQAVAFERSDVAATPPPTPHPPRKRR